MNLLLSSLKSSPVSLLGLFLAVLATWSVPLKASANSSLESVRKRAIATEIQPKSQNDRSTPITLINAQQSVAERSLEIQEIRGKVRIRGRLAIVGDRLSTIGDEIITDNNSQVRLKIDNNLGSIEVSENTTLQIETLSTAADGTPVTVFSVSRGRVRLSIRQSAGKAPDPNAVQKLSKPRIFAANNLIGIHQINQLAQQSNSAKNAPVRVRTPRGVAGVRGTSFGVSVSPNGKTAVDTIQGAVAVAGTQQEVLVNAGYWVVLNDLEPSLPQTNPPLSELKIITLSRLSSDIFRLVAKVNPMDLVYINDRAIQTNLDGTFKIEGALPLSRRLKVIVRGPSVRERVYELAVR